MDRRTKLQLFIVLVGEYNYKCYKEHNIMCVEMLYYNEIPLQHMEKQGRIEYSSSMYGPSTPHRR